MNWLRREGLGQYLNDAGLVGRGAFAGVVDDHLRKACSAAWRGRECLDVAEFDSTADRSLDFVYLGEGADSSLADAFRVVKSGGLLAGCGYSAAVKHAVDDFARALGIAPGFTSLDPDTPDWFLRIPHGPPPCPDQITVLTAYDPTYSGVGDISRPNKEAYCRRHGYRFVCRKDGFDTHRPASWSKLRFVREELAHTEWVFWNDADTLVMNGAVPLSRFCWDSHDLVLSGDPYHALNLGCWFARRSDWTFDFFDRIEAMIECQDHVWWETGAVLAAYASDPAVRGRIALLPNKLFNAYPYRGGGYAAGDVLIHFPGMERVRRETVMREFALRAV